MSDIVLPEEDALMPNVPPPPKDLQARMVRWGLAKDERQASILLVVGSVALLIAAGFLLFSGGHKSLEPATPAGNVINPAIIR